jgi:hypothetical protein
MHPFSAATAAAVAASALPQTSACDDFRQLRLPVAWLDFGSRFAAAGTVDPFYCDYPTVVVIAGLVVEAEKFQLDQTFGHLEVAAHVIASHSTPGPQTG